MGKGRGHQGVGQGHRGTRWLIAALYFSQVVELRENIEAVNSLHRVAFFVHSFLV